MAELAWHVRHDRLIQALSEPIEVRWEYIKRNKPPGEVETRLRLLRRVQGTLPPAIVKAAEARNKASVARDKALDKVRDEVAEAHNRARLVYDKEWAALGRCRDWPWHLPEEDCRAIRPPTEKPTPSNV